MDHRLCEIVQNGSPAQADLARRLLAMPTSAAIDLLYDAYLNDPYLTRG